MKLVQFNGKQLIIYRKLKGESNTLQNVAFGGPVSYKR